MIKIVSIGGGNGNPVAIEALLHAGVKNIQAIVAGTDDGGITGKMRIDAHGTKGAFSDGLRSLIALFAPNDLKKKEVKETIGLLMLRNNRQQVGYDINSILSEKFDNPFSELKRILETITGCKLNGDVNPTSTKPTELHFKTQNEKTYKGEHNLDLMRMSSDKVTKIWLEPPAKASKNVLKLIEGADLIVFSCGSLNGSIGVNFKHKGFKEALKRSKAKKVYITNLTSTRNETHDFKPSDFIIYFQKMSGLKYPLDFLIVPKLTQNEFEQNPQNKKVVQTYASENSHFLGWDQNEIEATEKKFKVKIVTHDATKIVDGSTNIIRHSPKKLSLSFKEILLKLT